jgi:hypothetical protein
MLEADADYVSSCISQFLVNELPTLGEKYQWPLPTIIPFDWDRPHSASPLNENISLRLFLADRWQSLDTNERRRIARWYVSD